MDSALGDMFDQDDLWSASASVPFHQRATRRRAFERFKRRHNEIISD